MTGTISGKTVVVVGGSRGIGLEVGMAGACSWPAVAAVRAIHRPYLFSACSFATPA